MKFVTSLKAFVKVIFINALIYINLHLNLKTKIYLLQAVEFTTSLFSDEYRFFMTKPRNSISWTTYTNVFNSQYWIAVAATMFFLTPILHIVFKYEKVRIK